MTSDAGSKAAVLLGVVGGAHGIKGEVRIRSFTAEPTDIGAYGPLFDDSGNRYTLLSTRLQKNVVVARIAEVADRTAAERLNGRELFVDRSALPATEDDDEFYLDDLVGFSVETLAGLAVGTVVAFHDFGAGDIVEIAVDAGGTTPSPSRRRNDRRRARTVMIPFSEAAIPRIDAARERLVVDPVAAGLDDQRPEAGEDAV